MLPRLRRRVSRLVDRIVGKFARVFAREFIAEFERSEISTTRAEDRQKIDVIDALGQLGGAEANVALQRIFAWNHRWVANLQERNRRTARETYDFIEERMADAVFLLDQFAYLESKKPAIESRGEHIIDLGVHTGASTRRLAQMFPDMTIHGFDSFEGLPEDWEHVPQGTFGIPLGSIPEMPDNVKLFKGWFEDSLPRWREDHRGAEVALFRVDCDIYSSTATAFNTLGDLLGPGSLVLFDELIGYRGWRNHEYKAFLEFLERRSLHAVYLAYGLTYVLVELES